MPTALHKITFIGSDLFCPCSFLGGCLAIPAGMRASDACWNAGFWSATVPRVYFAFAGTLSPTLRSQWELFECVCWSWHSATLAFWHVCVPCHNEAYPHLPRPEHANRYNSSPVVRSWRREPVRESVCRLACGGYYLTAPPPELWSKAALAQMCAALVRREALEHQGVLVRRVAGERAAGEATAAGVVAEGAASGPTAPPEAKTKTTRENRPSQTPTQTSQT